MAAMRRLSHLAGLRSPRYRRRLRPCPSSESIRRFQNAGRAHFRRISLPLARFQAALQYVLSNDHKNRPCGISTPCAAAHFSKFVRANAVSRPPANRHLCAGPHPEGLLGRPFCLLLSRCRFFCGAICIHESGIVAVPHFFRR